MTVLVPHSLDAACRHTREATLGSVGTPASREKERTTQ